MRMPKIPPKWPVLLEKVHQADRLYFVLGEIGKLSHTINGKYLHWDKLSYYPPPSGFTHEEWWLAIKLRRQNLSKQVPLTDSKGKPFSFALTDPIPESCHQMDQGAGGILMPDQLTHPETRDQYYVGSLIEEALTSSQLEGAVTTREAAKEMLRLRRPPRDNNERMVLNNYLTMREIQAFKTEPLTQSLCFHMHRLITDQTLADPSAAGRFRRADEYRVLADDYGEIFHHPPQDKLEERMAAMCEFANGETPSEFIHPVLRSIILHFWLAHDHPFVDGNGRVARALFYWSMLRHGFWLFEFLSISQIILKSSTDYYRAFVCTETDDNDLTYFILHHLEVIRQAIEHLHAFIQRKTAALEAIEDRLAGVLVLNHRQRALISHALRHPKNRCPSPSEESLCH